MPQVTGIVKVYVNGTLQRSKEGAKLTLGGKERTPIKGHKLYGFAEKFMEATIEFTLADMADTDLVKLGETIGAVVRFETDTGKVYNIANAVVAKPVELTGGEGDVAVEMFGDPAFEE